MFSILLKKLPLLFFIICLMLFNSITILAEEPFAPKIDLPEKMENRKIWVDIVESWNVPSKAEVGLPAYPGAFIVTLMESKEVIMNDDTLISLPSMTLATTDDQAKVVSFYKEKLKDWKFKNSYDMFDIFWIGPDEFNNMDMSQAMTIPNIVIFGSTKGEPNFMPEAKTAITIVYKPTK
jgi:hypothetical protein